MAAASQKEHFLDPLASGDMSPAAVSRLRATHTVAGSLSSANVRSSSSSQRYPHLYHHHRGGKNPSLISAPSTRALQATSPSSSSFDIQQQQQQPRGESNQDSNSTRHSTNRRLATNNAATGFDIDVYLASSPACGSDWEDALKRAYAPYLKQVILRLKWFRMGEHY